jgi:hypothetical protein
MLETQMSQDFSHVESRKEKRHESKRRTIGDTEKEKGEKRRKYEKKV